MFSGFFFYFRISDIRIYFRTLWLKFLCSFRMFFFTLRLLYAFPKRLKYKPIQTLDKQKTKTKRVMGLVMGLACLC